MVYAFHLVGHKYLDPLVTKRGKLEHPLRKFKAGKIVELNGGFPSYWSYLSSNFHPSLQVVYNPYITPITYNPVGSFHESTLGYNPFSMHGACAANVP